MRRLALPCALLSLALSACRSALPTAPRLPIEWSCEVPSALDGPLDPTLSPFATVRGVQVCAGDAGRVAVVWHREVDSSVLEWDDQIERYRVKGSDVTLEPSRHPMPEPRIFDHPLWPLESEVFKSDEYTAMAILGPAGVEASAFFSGYPASSFCDEVQAIAFLNGRWYGVLNLYAPQNAADPEQGIALAGFDASGWDEPFIALPDEYGGSIWALANGSSLDLFWAESYLPFLAFPDSGMDRQRLKHARARPGQASQSRTVYDFPHVHAYYRIVACARLGRDRCDLICDLTRWGLFGCVSDTIVHVPNVLRGWSTWPTPVVRDESLWRRQSVALSGDRIQLVWMREEPPDDEALCRTGIYRLREAHYSKGRWSGPVEIARHRGWREGSLASAAFEGGEHEGVLVLWQGEAGRLTYTVGSGVGEWCSPAETDLVIGSENWIVSSGTDFVLVTKLGRNLYWCRFCLSQVRSDSDLATSEARST